MPEGQLKWSLPNGVESALLDAAETRGWDLFPNTFHIAQSVCMPMARGSQGKIPEGQILQISSFLCRDVDRLTEMVAVCLAQQGPTPWPGIHKTVTENNGYTFPCHSAIGWVQLLLNLHVLCKDDCYGLAAPLVLSSVAGIQPMGDSRHAWISDFYFFLQIKPFYGYISLKIFWALVFVLCSCERLLWLHIEVTSVIFTICYIHRKV